MTFFYFGYHVHEKAILVQLTLLQYEIYYIIRVNNIYNRLIGMKGINWKLAFMLSINAGLSLLPLLPNVEGRLIY